MILCDRCGKCYHSDCAASAGGTQLHGGPFFCSYCKGQILHEGFTDVMEDWPLHQYLWAGTLPDDVDERTRILRLA